MEHDARSGRPTRQAESQRRPGPRTVRKQTTPRVAAAGRRSAHKARQDSWTTRHNLSRPLPGTKQKPAP